VNNLQAYIDMLGKAAQLEDKVLKFANAKLDRDKRYYGYATGASYGLYAIGWFLTFWGKILSVEGLDTVQ
jgi:hypothetical protein